MTHVNLKEKEFIGEHLFPLAFLQFQEAMSERCRTNACSMLSSLSNSNWEKEKFALLPGVNFYPFCC